MRTKEAKTWVNMINSLGGDVSVEELMRKANSFFPEEDKVSKRDKEPEVDFSDLPLFAMLKKVSDVLTSTVGEAKEEASTPVKDLPEEEEIYNVELDRDKIRVTAPTFGVEPGTEAFSVTLECVKTGEIMAEYFCNSFSLKEKLGATSNDKDSGVTIFIPEE